MSGTIVEGRETVAIYNGGRLMSLKVPPLALLLATGQGHKGIVFSRIQRHL